MRTYIHAYIRALSCMYIRSAARVRDAAVPRMGVHMSVCMYASGQAPVQESSLLDRWRF